MTKKRQLLTLLAFSTIALLGFVSPNPPVAAKYKMSKKVNAVVQDKCYGCHSPNARGDKAKGKLNWDELATLPATEQAQKMKSIQGVLEKGAMPPKMMVEKNPDKALTAKETALMKKWASKMEKKLSK